MKVDTIVTLDGNERYYLVDKAKTQGASEEDLKEAMNIQAEAVRQSGVEPAKQQELSI